MHGMETRGLGWWAEARATLALAWPLALTNLSQHAMAATDALILGWFSTEALAAGTLGANLYWLMMAPALGTGFAAAPVMAQARGMGQRRGGAGRGWMRELRRGARSALVATLILLLPSLLVLWQGESILRLMGQEPALARDAGAFLRAMMWGLIPFSAFIVLRGFLAAMDRPGPALWVTGAAVVANAPLCWLLVFGAFGWEGMGVAGAGLASALADLLMLLALLVLIARDRRLRRFRLLGRFWRIDWPRLVEVFRIGLPISGQMLMEIGVFSAAALAMGWFGATAVAAHAIALQVAALSFMVPMGIGQAATARVGMMAGRGDAAGAWQAGWVAIGLGAGFMLAMATLFMLAARPIAWAFLDAREDGAAAVAALGAGLLTIAGLFQLGDGVQAVAAGALRGLKDTKVPMLLAALGYWGIGMPVGVGLAVAAKMGPAGLWLGLAAGVSLVAGMLLLRWRRLSEASRDRKALAGA
ncbi:MATE family efflux transporter [Belnapia sp. T6]|uniref:Multidrug-efflux transporter n=2 Tax=Belnapia mucosa TaxID=2804532 RepID=A0ABS1V9C7_9PROT|nr:MATE family efflux transporter [Belnapia mucosa]